MADLLKELRLGPPFPPGKHEAAALASACETCGHSCSPVTVADETARNQRGRYATYECAQCGAAWLSWWPMPHMHGR